MDKRAWLGRGRDGQRPIPASAMFWLGLLAPLTARPFLDDARLLPWWLLAALAVLVLGLWPGMSWAPNQSLWWRPLLFALAVSTFGFADGTGLSSPLLVVALAQLVFTVGAKTTAFLAGAVIVVDGIEIRLIYRQSWTSTLLQVGSMVVIGGLIIVALHMAHLDRLRNKRTEVLLSELRVTHTELAERSEQLRQLAISEERARLARDVHDAVGHQLTVIKLNLTNAQRLRSVDETAAWVDVAEAKRSAADALDEVRRAVRALGPGPLATTNLGGALELLTQSYRRANLAIRLEIGGTRRPLGSILEASVYRLVEEGLTNVVKHAPAATRADVMLNVCDSEVEVSISDDGGRGSELIEGFGLAGARQRVAHLGGSFDVVADLDGVRLMARLPLAGSPVGQPV